MARDKKKVEAREAVEAKAVVRFVHISPRKVRPVINLIRRESIPTAFEILEALPQKGAGIVSKLLKSAVANAKQKGKLQEKDLYISRILANDAVRWKRIRPRAMGRADRYLKRTAHISVTIHENPQLKTENYGTKGKSKRV